MEQVSIDWHLSFLRAFESYPVSGEHTLGSLDSWYIACMSIDSGMEGSKAADLLYRSGRLGEAQKFEYVYEKYIEELENDGRTAVPLPEPLNLASETLTLEEIRHRAKARKRAIRTKLENHVNINFSGENRGRKYWWDGARVTIHDGLVARAIQEILKQLRKPQSWVDLYEYVQHAMYEFHRSLETSRTKQTRNQQQGKITILIEHEKGSELPEFVFHIFNQDIPEYLQSDNFDTDLLEFCENTYTFKWFNKNSSNIQRYLRKGQLVETSKPANFLKRGQWCHKDYLESKSKTETEFENLYEAMGRVNVEITRTSSKISSDDFGLFISMLEREVERLRKELPEKD